MAEIPALVLPLVSKDTSLDDALSTLRTAPTNAVAAVIQDGLNILSTSSVSGKPPLISDSLVGTLRSLNPSLIGDYSYGGLISSDPNLDIAAAGAGKISIDNSVLAALSSKDIVAILGYDGDFNADRPRLLGLFDKNDAFKAVSGVWRCPDDGEIFRRSGKCETHDVELVEA